MARFGRRMLEWLTASSTAAVAAAAVVAVLLEAANVVRQFEAGLFP